MKIRKNKISDSIQALIEDGDQILNAINYLLYDKNHVSFKSDIYIESDKIRDKFVNHAEKVYSEIRKYGLSKIEEKGFLPSFVPEVHMGLSFVGVEEIRNILQDIKKLIIEIKKDLIALSLKIPDHDVKIKKLDSVKIKFDEKASSILFDDKKYKPIIGSKELIICKFMFKKGVGENVSWDEPLEDEQLELNKTNKKMVFDTVARINKNIKKIVPTNDKLLNWKNNSISRLF